MKGFYIALLLTLVPLLVASIVRAGTPDPAYSAVFPWDNYGQAVVSPGTGGDSLLVLVRDGSGAFCRNMPVEIDFSDCTTLCMDCPSGLRETTNIVGLAVFDPRVTGCESCDVIVRAGGIVLRTYTRVVSPDWNGVESDGMVDNSDLSYFATVYPSSPAADDCLDFTGDGVIDAQDYSIFAACYLSYAEYPCAPAGPCELTPPCIEFGTVSAGSWEERTFTITNASGGTVIDSVTAVCDDFTIEAGGGPYTLLPWESLDVTVRFAPSQAGSLTCTVNTGSSLCGDYFCVGYADFPPACEVAPITLAFDTVTVGNWRNKTFTIRNSGGGVLVDSVVATCPHYTITGGEGPYALVAEDSLVVNVRFEPGAAGSWLCAIHTGACVDVSCEGYGMSPPVEPVEPEIVSILDVGNDQGRYVRILWTRCAYDTPDDTLSVSGYAVYRRQDQYMATNTLSTYMRDDTDRPARSSLVGWDYVATVPARGDSLYQTVAPTLCDSTLSAGMCWSVFLVSAMNPDSLVFWDSAPDSGYSLDNLAPGIPDGLSVACNTGNGNQLVWDPCTDDDFDYFCIYRGPDDDFIPNGEHLVGMTTDPAWTDPGLDGGPVCYKITAVDFAGNESDAGSADQVTGVVGPALPATFALHQNVPNPFNPRTTIRFDVPNPGGWVTLRVYDTRGRLVRTLVDSAQSPGHSEAQWSGVDNHGQSVASGVYFYRMTAPGFEMTRKMVLLK